MTREMSHETGKAGEVGRRQNMTWGENMYQLTILFHRCVITTRRMLLVTTTSGDSHLHDGLEQPQAPDVLRRNGVRIASVHVLQERGVFGKCHHLRPLLFLIPTQQRSCVLLPTLSLLLPFFPQTLFLRCSPARAQPLRRE